MQIHKHAAGTLAAIGLGHRVQLNVGRMRTCTRCPGVASSGGPPWCDAPSAPSPEPPDLPAPSPPAGITDITACSQQRKSVLEPQRESPHSNRHQAAAGGQAGRKRTTDLEGESRLGVKLKAQHILLCQAGQLLQDAGWQPPSCIRPPCHLHAAWPRCAFSTMTRRYLDPDSLIITGRTGLYLQDCCVSRLAC